LRASEREKNPEETFDGGYHLYAKEKRKERVSKNGERIRFATALLLANKIEFALKNESTGHFHCYRKFDDKLIQFWAGTGKILNYKNQRGIHNLIKILKGED